MQQNSSLLFSYRNKKEDKNETGNHINHKTYTQANKPDKTIHIALLSSIIYSAPQTY